MSVNPVDNSSAWAAVQQNSSGQSMWQNVMSAAAGALGESASAVQQQLQGGSSLSSIAQAQGVSQQSLVQAIAGALSQGGSTTASGDQLQQIATNIANRVPGGHHGGHHRHHGTPSVQSATDATSADSDPDTLLTGVDELA